MKKLLRQLTGLACISLLFGALQSGAAFAQAAPKKQPTTAPAGPTGPTGPASSSPKTANGTVAYLDLKNKKAALPYGEPFTITGNTADVQLSGGALTDLMTPQTVAGDYTTSDGNKGTIAPSSITAGAWQVSIGKLTADTSATFNFQFTGTLSANMQQIVFDDMLADPAYKAATAQFTATAQGQAATAQLAAMTLLAQAAADVVTASLNKKGLTPKTPADLKSSLSAALLSSIEPIFNLGEKFDGLLLPANKTWELLNMTQADFTALSEQQLYEKLKVLKDDPTLPPNPVRTNAVRFAVTYQNAMSGLEAGLKAALFLGTSSLAVGNDTQSDIVSDLMKYAGFDVGALYSYRLSELRSFAMVNIYFGPVQLKTDALPTTPGAGGWLRERLSLTIGMALKDLSGASKSKITSEDAFVYGLGFRLNKYFRISAGGMLYRTTLPAANGVTSPANGTLRQEFFIGPSIDVTALPALQSIFAKSKSN